MAKKQVTEDLPAVELVLQRFEQKGVKGRQLARDLNLTELAVAKWRYRGVIPRRADVNYDAQILQLAKDYGVKLSAEELIYGGHL